MIKFCKDCKHFKPVPDIVLDLPVSSIESKCMHPNAAVNRYNTYLVTGELIYDYAYKVRTSGVLCTTEGKWYYELL